MTPQAGKSPVNSFSAEKRTNLLAEKISDFAML
jgi:hypothetical protein